MSVTAASEVVGFLAQHPPFDALEPPDLERLAGAAELEAYAAGSTIFFQGAEPVRYLRVIRSGAVEILSDGRVLDLLGEGELFGHASMLSGLPPGFEARAVEETVCIRIPAEVAEGSLAQPAALRFVARSLLEPWAADPRPQRAEPRVETALQPVGSLIRDEPVVCRPDTPIRGAAQLMAAAGATSAVVDLGHGTLGIITDHDLRSRVIAGGLGGQEPVSAAMSAPAYTCAPDRLAGDVLLEMLDRGIRHFPVVSATGEILGVVEEIDVAAAQTHSPFFLRRRIAMAEDVDQLVEVASDLGPAVISLHDSRIAPERIAAVYSVVVDALTRRLLELAIAGARHPGVEFAWLALGSQARREALPSSDVDSAIVWFGGIPDDEVRPRLHVIATAVVDGLRACGLEADAHGATASDILFVRSLASWQRVVRSWIADPTQEKALILASVLVDSRPVWGVHTGTPVSDTFHLAPGNPSLLRMLARFAISHRPPTGFFRGLVVESTGEHRGRLDLKLGGILPIVDLARWAGMAAGVTSASTVERLRAGARAGVLPDADARTLEDAFVLITALRLEHQVAQLRAGEPPDDHVDPAGLSPLTRSYLKDTFRAVAAVQKHLGSELSSGMS